MKRTVLGACLIIALATALSPAFASDAVCRKGTIQMAGMEEALLGFAWQGTPTPLSKGIMFETLLDRSDEDNELVALVASKSCSAWEETGSDKGSIRLRFYDQNGKALVLGDGNAVVKQVSCDQSTTRLVVKVDKSFNIGMPPT